MNAKEIAKDQPDAKEKYAERLEKINSSIKRGDVKTIAQMAGVHRVWVSYVLHGKGTSEPVLKHAELLLSERYRAENRAKRKKKATK